MEEINSNTFYIKQMLFIIDLRKNIFIHQLLENIEINMVIYFDKDKNEFKIGKNEDIYKKNITIIYKIKNWYYRDNENLDFSKLYDKVYIKLTSNTKDDIKEILSNEIYMSDDDFEIFYSQLLKSKEESFWDDWLSFYLFIQDLTDNNKFFRNYFNIIRVKEYLKQKIESDELRYIEDIVYNFKYEDVFNSIKEINKDLKF